MRLPMRFLMRKYFVENDGKEKNKMKTAYKSKETSNWVFGRMLSQLNPWITYVLPNSMGCDTN